ncbi:putative MFS transporter [Aspergillus fijiensis CBS 313.89]|uniref:MFS general substrate transporter n=1 Tax=Aspergillus fijiensis CBS 313.89 TaxID=1448319 RepID=A0A8G1RF18_9EURO|nr:MFS general substrate transporter [Aspergillus fijiensis CBS 313.89]RAK72637.1 MFS general substrate transporter [Aspergillus fijiensis CBS 313.89]
MDPLQPQSKDHEPAKQELLVEQGRDDEEHQRWIRNLFFKMDCRLLPTLSGLFLCSFLDRTNVGNAKILGLEDDVNISGHQYDIGLTVFYIMYICSELPSNLVIRKASPKVWLPFLTMIWGIFTMCLGFVRNFAGFVVVRALLGTAEGGLLPGIVLYLSFFYRRNDLALRIGVFYTAASLSGAFGGLLARGLAQIGPRGGLEGWRWIMIIEGLLTFSVGGLSCFLLPNSLETAFFLTPEERAFALERVMLDTPSVEYATTEDERETLKWTEVRRGLLDPRMWLSATAYFSILSGLYSFGLFLPTIIEESGFARDPNQVQFWTVIPYAVATVVTVVVAVVSDRLQLRGVVMLFTLPVAIAGYGAIANIYSPSAKYAMTCLMATGLYSSVPCILVWNSNNSAGHYKRATTSAMQLTIANCGGLLATFNYPDQDKPQYHRGHTVVLGLLVFAWFMIFFNVLYCAKINRDKAQGKYAQYAGCHDDRDPAFRMML